MTAEVGAAAVVNTTELELIVLSSSTSAPPIVANALMSVPEKLTVTVVALVPIVPVAVASVEAPETAAHTAAVVGIVLESLVIDEATP